MNYVCIWSSIVFNFRVTKLFHFARAVRLASGTPVGSGKTSRTPLTIPSISGLWASQTNLFQIGLKSCRGRHRKKPPTDSTTGIGSICPRSSSMRLYLQPVWRHQQTCLQHRRDFIEEFLLQLNVCNVAEENFWWKTRNEKKGYLDDVIKKKPDNKERKNNN